MKKKEAKANQLSQIKIDIAGVLHYNEYVGSIEYDSAENIFYGKVLYINDSVLFSGESLEELSKEFEISVKDYLEMCKQEGLEPNKPMSGVFNIRTTPENHYCLSVISKREKTSLNNIVNEAIKEFISVKWVISNSSR